MLNLIHNPTAGRGRGKDAARRVQALLDTAGVEHRTWTTERPGHATEIAASLPDAATIVAIGGDGTVHEVAAACIGTTRTVGIVPQGSGDDLAHALGLPRQRIEPAVAAIVAGRTRVIDTGICNGEPFLNAVGTGFDAEVGARVTEAPAPLSGVTAYLWSVFATLRDFSLASVRVEADGVAVFEGPSLLVSIQNGPRTGGSFHFVPSAQIDDGRLDVIVAGSLTRLGTLGLLPRVMVGRHLSHPKVHLAHATHVRVAWSTPRPWHAEGEIQAPSSLLDIQLKPKTLRIIAP